MNDKIRQILHWRSREDRNGAKKGKSKTLLMSKLWKLDNQRPCEDRDTNIGKETETGGTIFQFNNAKILEAKRGQMEKTVPKEGP